MSEQTMTPTSRQQCLVIRHNHFDPTWRRCWDREFVSDGQRFISYRTIQELWIRDMLALSADPRTKFLLETTWSTRHYLQNHPEAADLFARLRREGRYEQLGAGENIMDTNLVHGELLLRNMALGSWWSEEVLGARPVTGYYRDAFGTSAQLPQIFRQCGYRWIAHLDYNLPDKPYWRGLDGSTILYLHPQYTVPFAWAAARGMAMRICSDCKGYGCTTCNRLGANVGQRSDFVYQPKERWNANAVIFLIGNEENLPGLHVGDQIDRFNAEQSDFFATQAIYQDVEPFISEQLALVDTPPADMVSSKVENNPCITGVYVGRIKIKQQHRAIEHALMAAETWDTLLGSGAQAGVLRDVWRDLTFSGFHDAITSSFCDDSYYELLDMQADMRKKVATASAQICTPLLTEQDGAITLFNHQGFAASAPVTVTLPGQFEGATMRSNDKELPVYTVEAQQNATLVTFQSPEIPALGAQSVRVTPAPARTQVLEEREVSCGAYTLVLGEQGVSDVRVAGYGSVTDTSQWFFGELIIEEDKGDPWSTRSFNHGRERLAQYTTLREVRRQEDSITVRYEGTHPSMGIFGPWDPMILLLEWEQTFHLRAGSPWLEVETAVEWFTFDRRLRIAFPSNTGADCGVYEIPYGVLERERYEATTDEFLNPDGDWPAIHWAGIQANDYTFAIFNQGTPSYRVEDGTVLVSVLRSPTSPGGLLQPRQYVAHNFTTLTDHGSHHFHHALYLGAGDWRANGTVQQAALFNAGLTAHPGTLRAPLPAWELQADHTMLTTVKPAENGQGVILRLVEHAGQEESVTLLLPEHYRAATLCNLLEDDLAPLEITDRSLNVAMAPNKIVTVRITE